MTNATRGGRLLAALAFSALLLACAKGSDSRAEDGPANAQISAYNHTKDYIHQFYVDGTWGGNSFAYGGGGKFVCCMSYPRQWRPGMVATVRWTTSSSDPKATGDETTEHWDEMVVPIDLYRQAGTTLNLHFLAHGEMRLVISSLRAYHPDYPGPAAPVMPADFKFRD
jgi:hypothetical protein